MEAGEFARQFCIWEAQYVVRSTQFSSIIEQIDRIWRPVWELYGQKAEELEGDMATLMCRGVIDATAEHCDMIRKVVKISRGLYDEFGYGCNTEKLCTIEILKLIASGVYFGRPEDIPWVIDYSFRPYNGGKDGFIYMGINVHAPMKAILAEVQGCIELAQRHPKPESPINVWSISEDAQCAARGKFLPQSSRARAAGLWLWDRVQELGDKRGTAKQAIQEFRASDDIHTIDVENAEDADLRFYLKRTAECIAKPGVLSFSKKGTRKAHRVPGTRERE